MLRLTREGCCYLFLMSAVFAGAAVRDSNLMLLLAGMVTGPFVLSLLLVSWGLRHVEVARKLPEGMWAGDRLVAELTCTNRGGHLTSWGLIVEDAWDYPGP